MSLYYTGNYRTEAQLAQMVEHEAARVKDESAREQFRRIEQGHRIIRSSFHCEWQLGATEDYGLYRRSR